MSNHLHHLSNLSNCIFFHKEVEHKNAHISKQRITCNYEIRELKIEKNTAMKKVIFYLLLLIAFNAKAEYTFQQISPNGGLVQESINDIIQDNNGAIWIATKNGLIRYTTGGYQTFLNIPGDSTSLPNNGINSLFIDENEKLWVSTSYGECIYNPEQNNFIPFHFSREGRKSQHDNILQLHIDNLDNIWILHYQGLGILNRANKHLFSIELPNNQMPSVLYQDEENNLWLGTTKGYLFQIDKKTLQCTEISNNFGSKIRCIYNAGNSLWIGTQRNGIKNISYDGKEILHPTINQSIAPNEDVRSILINKDNDLWIGTYHGLYIYNRKDKITHFDVKTKNLPHPSIYKVYEDRNQGIWIGTWSGGLSYYNKYNNNFKNFRHNESTSSLSNNIVSCFTESPTGKIYVGTEAGGINYFNTRNENFKVQYLDTKKTTANIKCQTFDKYGGHWVGTNKNGLWYKAKGQQYFKHFEQGNEDGKHISYNEIYALQATKNGVWIGTHGGGVNYYDFKTKKISFVKINFEKETSINRNYIRTLYVAPDHTLWIGTLTGAFKIDLKSAKREAHIINNDYIYYISPIGQNEIWIATKYSGILIYNTQKDTSTTFNPHNLTLPQSIYGILEDNNKNIWITSENGLILYNSATQEARKFTVEDGIQGTWFIAQSVFKSSTNDLYFGGTNGFTMVNPTAINKNQQIPKGFISKVTINNTKDLYHKSFERETLKLKPKENTLRVFFHSDNYLSSSKNQFQYRVLNYIDDWEQVTNQSSVLIANLNPGKYTFELKTANNDGIWSSESTTFDLIIKKPFYRSIVAILLYFVLTLGVILIALRTAKHRLSLKAEIDKERMRHQQEEQVQELKLRLFTNISHEFRTPLTLITGPLKRLINDPDLSEKQRNTADIIHRNTQRLLNLINQLIDLRKIDKGVEELDVCSKDIIAFIKESAENFKFKADEKHINFEITSSIPKIIINFDPVKIDYIITNLLSNAFKYTQKNGNISIDISQHSSLKNNFSNQLMFGNEPEGESISVSITDNGCGIEGNELSLIFNRFKQGREHKEGSGIGLYLCKQYVLLHHGCLIVQSTNNEGSSFTFKLPTRQSGSIILQDNNIISEEYTTPTLTQDIPKHTIENDEHKSKESILIVEDNKDLSKYISNLLQEHHYKTVTAGNGKEALELMIFNKIDLIISDVMMPEMDGFELCTKIKSDLSSCHIPIILLTALNTTQNQVTGLKKGADAYISKPFEEEHLLTQIANLCQQRKQLHEYFATQHPPLGPNSQLEGLDNYFLSKLNAVIMENLDNEELDVDLIIKTIRLSRSQLHRKLKQLTNFSITEYVRRFRLEKAIELMKSKEFNIDEIAYRVGFNTHSYFTRCFKKQYGVSPKEYMKNNTI